MFPYTLRTNIVYQSLSQDTGSKEVKSITKAISEGLLRDLRILSTEDLSSRLLLRRSLASYERASTKIRGYLCVRQSQVGATGGKTAVFHKLWVICCVLLRGSGC
jgi:hypothetical protein